MIDLHDYICHLSRGTYFCSIFDYRCHLSRDPGTYFCSTFSYMGHNECKNGISKMVLRETCDRENDNINVIIVYYHYSELRFCLLIKLHTSGKYMIFHNQSGIVQCGFYS